jgi:phospholipid/cholesterol/gamma-HCH transport system permease protein
MIEALGAKAIQDVLNAGHFGRFAWRSVVTSARSCSHRRTYPLIWNQMFIIGVRSVPVIMATGAFVGMTLAVQAYDQLAGMGLEEHLGVLINISVVKELGPVLAAVMLAGRIGGALTARLLSCLLLTPVLTIFADLLGVIGGALVSFLQFGINSRAYWTNSAYAVDLWDISVGVAKAFFFGGAIATISCYKGFTCKEGAHGVGQACTEAFVASFVSILALDFALAVICKNIYETFWPLRSIVG